MSIELVNTLTSDGVRLDGTLQTPAAGVASTLGVDAVILHHGANGNFYNPGAFDAIAAHIVAAGTAVLSVNSRGHDGVVNSARGRLGGAYEIIDDCRADWRAWLDFAAGHGYERIALWGHSLGALKTIYYLATEDDRRVPWAVAMSPPRFSVSRYGEMSGGEVVLSTLATARERIAAGTPLELLEATQPIPALLTAQTYVDKYGSERYNLLDLLPRVSVPVFATVGTEEGAGPGLPMWLSIGELATDLPALAARVPNLTFELIEGANHAYAGRVDAVWSAATRWLERLA